MLKITRGLHREDGQSIVTVALMSMFILAILGVAADTGYVWLQRRNLQNSADAAALAGAQELPGPATTGGPADLAARDYAARNLTNLASTTVTFPDQLPDTRATSVKVVVHKDSQSLFGIGLGFGAKDISAKATARIASFNVIRCVVPLAVQDSAYFTATNNYPSNPIANPPPLVELKVAVQSGSGGSNTGLVNLGPGNSALPIATGSGCGLTPMIPTKPGGTIGDVNNGIQTRLEAAKANNCYTWAAVQPPSVTGAATWRCKPENTVQSDGTQASAVVLLPVLRTDIVQSGARDYPIAQLANGQYLLAYFWLSGDDTYDTTRRNWSCLTSPDCVLKGRFIVNQPVDLSTFDPAKCVPGQPQNCVINFDPAATTKIVQLID